MGLKQFLCFQSTSYPNTIIENIKMLAPGAYAKFSLNDFKLSMEKYWSINIQAKSLHSKNYYSIVSEVKKVLISSVKKRMVADVDVAAFLSGGIDSSIIVGIMSQLGIKNINTFSLVHDENEFDESFFSDLVASKFKTNHYKVKISKDELVSEVTAALNQFDSPSADGLNSYIVSKKIREIGIKVALSGLGGDELFAGYPQFKYWYYISKYRKLFSSLKIFNFLLNKSNNYHYKLSKIIFSDFSSDSINQIFRDISKNYYNTLLSKNINFPHKELIYNKSNDQFKISNYSKSELEAYTTNVLLKDADQTSMAHGLEVRVPFLDHKLVDYVISLQDSHKKVRRAKRAAD